ncbi:MAG: TonB-dependent receptor [Burkholderiales bacterium]
MRIATVAALAALATYATHVLAQSDGAVLIEATRFPEEAQRLPASVTVLNADDIARSPARTLPELLSGQAGLTMKDFYGNNAATTSIDLRGFGVTGTQNTLILVDGRRVTDIDLSGVQWAAIPLSSIERIEILRGTGAVLYGDGATAGVINIITRSPLKQGKAFEAQARVGTYRTNEGQLYASAAGESLGVNATLYGYDSQGYRDNNRNLQRNSSLNLRWGPGESYLDMRFGTDRQDLRLPGARTIQPSIGLDEYAADPRGAQTPLDWSTRDGDRAGATLVTRIGDTELNVGADWRGKHQTAYFDQMGFPSYRDDELDYTALTPRLRIPFGLGGTSHRLTLGVDWVQWRYDSKRTGVPQDIGQPVNRVGIDRESLGWYAQDAIQLTSSTLATLGWREESVDYDATDKLDPTAPGGAFGTEAPAASQRQQQHAWELGLKQVFSAEWNAFARAGRSYRFVGVDEIYENDAFFNAQFQILRPQTARTNEIGGEWRGARARTRLTLFQIDVQDEIHLDPFTTGVGNTNLPPSRRQGMELEGESRVAGQLRIFGAYTWTDARFLDGVLPGSGFAIGTNLDIAGRHVPLVPEHKIDLGATWDIDARTQLTGTVTAMSAQYMDNDEPNTLGTQIPAFAVADLKLAHDFGWGRLAAAANNLFDEKYYTYAVRSAFTPDRYSVYPLPGRTFYVSAEFRLD